MRTARVARKAIDSARLLGGNNADQGERWVWVKACVDCLERGVNARCELRRVERSPASEPCAWCQRLITGIRIARVAGSVTPETATEPTR